MARENLPSMLEDRQGVRLDDYIEDDLTRIYVYEQQTVKNEFITLYTQGVTFIVMARASAIPTIDKDGNHYFEALAEITQSGELQAVNKNELGNTKFVNSKTARLLTNGFKNKLTDGPKLYTIGKPFDYDEYMKGNQGVYVATISPTGMFSKQDLIEDNVIKAENLLEDVELTQMTLNNLLAIEKSVAASRLVILPYAGNLEDPRVDVQKGKYAIKTWDETRTANGLVNKPLDQIQTSVSGLPFDYPSLNNNRDTVVLDLDANNATITTGTYPVPVFKEFYRGTDVYAISVDHQKLFKNYTLFMEINNDPHWHMNDTIVDYVISDNLLGLDNPNTITACAIIYNEQSRTDHESYYSIIYTSSTGTIYRREILAGSIHGYNLTLQNFRIITTLNTDNTNNVSIYADAYSHVGEFKFLGIFKENEPLFMPTLEQDEHVLSTVCYTPTTHSIFEGIGTDKGNIYSRIVSNGTETTNKYSFGPTYVINGFSETKFWLDVLTTNTATKRYVIYQVSPHLDSTPPKVMETDWGLAQTTINEHYFKVITDGNIDTYIIAAMQYAIIGKNDVFIKIDNPFGEIGYYDFTTDTIYGQIPPHTNTFNSSNQYTLTNAKTTELTLGVNIIRKINGIEKFINITKYTFSQLGLTDPTYFHFKNDLTQTEATKVVEKVVTENLSNILLGKYPLQVLPLTDKGAPALALPNNTIIGDNYLLSNLRIANQLKNTVVEYKFNIVWAGRNTNATDPIKPENRWQDKFTVFEKDVIWQTGELSTNNNILALSNNDTISFEKTIPVKYENIIKYFLKNQPGFKVQLSSQALLSALTVTTLQNGIRQDLEMRTDLDFVPIMIRVIDDRDRVEIQVPWFDTSVTAPIYKVKPFMKNDGATLKELFTVGSPAEQEIDLTCLWDMITITKLVREKFKTITVEENNEIGHGNKFCSTTTSFTTQAFKGGTAAQLNDSIYEAWRLDNNLSYDDERVKQMRQIIALLSLYIASPDAIAGGTNRFNQVCQPYYLQGLEGLLTVDIGTPTQGGKGEGSRWVAKVIDKPASGSTAAVSKDIKEWKLLLKSEYFDITDGKILAKSISDLTKTMFKTGDAKVELPVLPTTVTKQNALTKASDFEQKSSDGVSHIVYLPIKALEAFKLLYLENETAKVNSNVSQSFKVTLPDTFHHELTQDELDTKLAEYMWKRYGVKPKEADPENGYSVTRPFTKSVLATERTFIDMTDQETRGWPKWLEQGCENFYMGDDVYLWGDMTHRLNDAGYSVAERIALGAHQSGNKNPLYTHHDHPDEWYLPYIVKNYYGEYKNVDLADIKILNYNSAVQEGNLEIFYNEEMVGTDYRWWHLKFTFTVPVVKYADAIVEFKGKFSDYSDNVRGSVFTKSEFYELLATLNMSNDYFYDEPLHELTFWTNNKIDYIEAVDLTALFVDEINIVINGYVIPVPALNRETPAITYQKIILP